MLALSNWLFDPSGLTPHGFCLLWEPGLIWTYASADLLIGISYLTIPLALSVLARKRRDLMFRPVFLLFAVFISLCGVSHLLDVVTLWVPAYGLLALVKSGTAIVSVITAVAVWRLLPAALGLPSHAQVEAKAHALHHVSAELAARQRLLDMVNAAPVMFRELDGTIRSWSDGCQRLYGWSAAEAIGRLSHDLLRTIFPVSLDDTDATMLRDGVWSGELHHRTRGNQEVIVAATMTLHDDVDGRRRLVVETVTDVSALRAAQMELQTSEAQYASLVETAADGFVVAFADGRIKSVNAALLAMFGYDRAEEVIGENLRVLMATVEAMHHDSYLAAHQAGGPPRAIGVPGRELFAVRRDGTVFPIDLSVSSFGADSARFLTGIIRDATARKQAETALRQSEARSRDLLLTLGLGTFMARTVDGSIQYWSDGCERIYGWTAEEAVGRSAHKLLCTIFPVPLLEIEEALARDGEWTGNLRHRTRDGQELTMAAHKRLRRSEDGQSAVVLEALTDVTAHTRTESALRDSEARLRLVQQVGGIAYSDQLATETEKLISREFVQLYGLPPTQTHITDQEWTGLLHPEDRDRVLAERRSILQHGGTLTTEFRICRSDGAVRWVTKRIETFLGADGQPNRVVCAQQDITEIVAARRALAVRQQELEQRVVERTSALADAEARFRGIFDSQFQFINLLGPDGTVLEANRTALDAGGLTRSEVIGQAIWETAWWPVHERDQLHDDIDRAAQGALIRREIEINGAAGRTIWVDFSLTPTREPTTNAIRWIIAEGRDLTERRNMANQLAQAQKMTALGQLAGGIAHDFNNILQAVSSAAGLLRRRPGHDDKTHHLADTIVASATRGTSITQRLLSFARRGELRAEPLQTTDLLRNMREVLEHTLGSTIKVVADIRIDVPALIADLAQLETAIVNLGTNARDAMPDGGTLTLSAEAKHVGEEDHHPAGLEAGDYVRLCIVDTGTGMDAATLARVSEPFFTTKPVGQGTGLGVAMVKGFVEQSGGALTITSEPGAGTTVTMWLRQATSGMTSVSPVETVVRSDRGIAGRILVVDDDDLVREMLATSLEEAGFDTLVASSGLEAVALINAGETVDAMVSDLSMPGINGLTTIQKVRAMRPRLPCFLLTGYAGDRAALTMDGMFTLLRKPMDAPDLVAHIEAGLESARHSDEAAI